MEINDNWKGRIKMKVMTRRKFMGTIVGGLTAIKVGLGKSEQGRLSEKDLKKVAQDVKDAQKKFGTTSLLLNGVDEDVNIADSAGFLQQEYDVIDDLVEEMNKHDTKHPEQEFRYFIYCNYSGLGMLDSTGQLTRGMYRPDIRRGYRYLLWFPLNLQGYLRGVNVGISIIQKADIILVCCPEKCCKEFHIRHYELVTQRFFNVDYSERGKSLMARV